MRLVNSTYRAAAFLVIAIFLIDVAAAQTLQGRSGNWQYSSMSDADASGATELVLSGLVGNVTVKGSNTTRISITESFTLTSDSESDARRDAEAAKITVVRSGNRMELRYSRPEIRLRGSSYEVVIPASMQVNLDVTSGNLIVSEINSSVRLDTGSGNVNILNVSGPVEIRSGAGNITLENVSSEIEVNTGAGNVLARKLRSDLAVTSGGGNAEITDVVGDIKIVTAGGEVFVEDIQGKAELYTSGGNITARAIGGSLEASTSGGEIEVSDVEGVSYLRTYGGGVRANNMAASIRAESSAGDIRLTGLRGSFQVLSEVGNIFVQMDSASFMSSGGATIEGRFGNVTLVLPVQMKGRVLASVSDNGSVLFKNPGPQVKILKERATSRSDEVRRAEYEVGSGGGQISVTTRSGNIEISQTGAK